MPPWYPQRRPRRADTPALDTFDPVTKRDLALIHIAEIRRVHLGVDLPPDDLYVPDDPEAA